MVAAGSEAGDPIDQRACIRVYNGVPFVLHSLEEVGLCHTTHQFVLCSSLDQQLPLLTVQLPFGSKTVECWKCFASGCV